MKQKVKKDKNTTNKNTNLEKKKIITCRMCG